MHHPQSPAFRRFATRGDRVARPVPLPSVAPLAPSVSLDELVVFKARMAAEGRTVHLARMCYDRPYAFERVADAHASAQEGLRRQALSLFQAYQRRDADAQSSP